MRLLRALGIALLALLVLVLGTALAARFSDGPIGPFAGGALVSGALRADAEVAWSSVLAGGALAELQLIEPPRSRTVGFVVLDGELYVPCFYPGFSAWKQWPYEALLDGRSLLRIQGTRYARRAVRVTDSEEFERVWRKMVATLGAPDRELVWIFRMDPWPEAADTLASG